MWPSILQNGIFIFLHSLISLFNIIIPSPVEIWVQQEKKIPPNIHDLCVCGVAIHQIWDKLTLYLCETRYLRRAIYWRQDQQDEIYIKITALHSSSFNEFLYPMLMFVGYYDPIFNAKTTGTAKKEE